MIRNACPSDIHTMLEIYRPYVERSTCTFEYTLPTPEEFAARFAGITARFPWFVWEEDGVVLGYAYASAPWERAAYRWCAEVSIYLARGQQRKRIGSAMYAALEDTLKDLGYQVVYAVITSENTASVAFHTALGYRELAVFPNCGFKFGRWLSVTWMEKRLSAPTVPEGFPLPYREFLR